MPIIVPHIFSRGEKNSLNIDFGTIILYNSAVMNNAGKESLCPSCLISSSPKAIPARLCRETGMSGNIMRAKCPLSVKQATDSNCNIISGKEMLLPPNFLSKWKIVKEQGTKTQASRFGQKPS
jgi:hypothetical protein